MLLNQHIPYVLKNKQIESYPPDLYLIFIPSEQFKLELTHWVHSQPSSSCYHCHKDIICLWSCFSSIIPNNAKPDHHTNTNTLLHESIHSLVNGARFADTTYLTMISEPKFSIHTFMCIHAWKVCILQTEERTYRPFQSAKMHGKPARLD